MSNETGERLRDLQRRQCEWRIRNFGKQPAHLSLLGMVEEYGEACEAMGRPDATDYLDAVADFAIFMLGYCTAKGWDAAELWWMRRSMVAGGRPWPELLGRLCHHELKAEQGIRGSREEHDAAGRACAAALLGHLERVCELQRTEFLVLVERVLADVEKRRWKP